jgi:aminoglycoside phosphotransferase (APT) family kinase protein
VTSVGGRHDLTTPWRRWLEGALCDTALRAEDVSSRWGATVTMKVTLATRGPVALQASRDGPAMERRRVLAEHLRARTATPRIPRPLAWTARAGTHLLATEWLEGQRATELLAGPEGARRLAGLMGSAIATIGTVDAADLGLEPTWADPQLLDGAVAEWLRETRDALPRAVWARVRREVAVVPEAVASGARVLAHGDLVPVNMLIAGDHVAVLDLEHARLGTPAFDVAHARSILRHYHPSAWRVMERTFLGAAGSPTDRRALDRLDAIAHGQGLMRLASSIRAGESTEAPVAWLVDELKDAA